MRALEDDQVSAQVPCPRIHKGLPFCVAPQNFLARGLDPTIFGADLEVAEGESSESRYTELALLLPCLSAFSPSGAGANERNEPLPQWTTEEAEMAMKGATVLPSSNIPDEATV